jgi:hypothetical protein
MGLSKQLDEFAMCMNRQVRDAEVLAPLGPPYMRTGPQLASIVAHLTSS